MRNAFGSVSDPDPDSIRSVDPDPDSESGSGSRKAKVTHKKVKKFHILNCWMCFFDGERLLL